MPGLTHFNRKLIFIGIVTTLLNLCISCNPDEELSVNASFAIKRGDLSITFDSNTNLVGYSVFDEKDLLALQGSLPDERTGEIRISRSTRKMASVIEFRAQNGERIDLNIPELTPQLVIRTPFESRTAMSQPMLLSPGLFSAVVIELGDTEDQVEIVQVDVESPLVLENSDGQSSSIVLKVSKGQHSIGGIRLGVNRATIQDKAVIRARLLSLDGKTVKVIERIVKISDVSELQSKVQILDASLSAESDDRFNGGKKEDYLDMGPVSKRINDRSRRVPISQQKVTLASSFSVPVTVLVSVQVKNTKGEVVSAFNVPPGKPGPNVTSAAVLPASGEVTVTLPFYADTLKALPGRYNRIVLVKLAGTDLVLAELKKPLDVGRSIDLPLMVTAIVCVVTLLVFGWLILRRSRVLDRFTTRQIVISGLFSAASVVIINVPVYFLTSITLFLLGPLGFLIDGLLSEFVFFALLTILVSIVPVQGICATIIGTRFLLGGVLLGMVTPVGILYAITMGVFLEIAILLSGIVRHSSDEITPKSMWVRLVILFGVANTIVSWVGFQLAVVLFRLHYADWYVFLSVIVGGFLYALFGSIAGRAIGRRMAKVAI